MMILKATKKQGFPLFQEALEKQKRLSNSSIVEILQKKKFKKIDAPALLRLNLKDSLKF